MSRSVVGVRAQRALYVAGAFAVSLSISVFAASNAEAAPTTASWYGPGFAGNPTASGEPFNPQALTAAHKTLPFGTQVEICDDACAVVTINDRGPYANGAEYDLSQGAAEATGLIDQGVGTVDATILGQGGASEPAPEPTPEPAPEPEPAAAPQAAAPQAAAPQAAAEPVAADPVAAAPQQQVSDVQNSQISQESNVDVNVFEQSPGYFVSNVNVPVGPEGYQAAYERALEIAQQRANAAAGLA